MYIRRSNVSVPAGSGRYSTYQMLQSVKNLDGRGSSVNILYGQALDRMEDTLELARKLIILQTLLHGFDRNEARFPGLVEFPVCADPFNVVTEFCILDVQSPYNVILGRSWIHMMRAVPSTHHQLLKYPTLSGMANIRVDQATARTVTAVT